MGQMELWSQINKEGPVQGTGCKHGELNSGIGSGHTHSRVHTSSCQKYDANGDEVSVEACGDQAEIDERYDLLCTNPTDYLFTVEDPQDPTESVTDTHACLAVCTRACMTPPPTHTHLH